MKFYFTLYAITLFFAFLQAKIVEIKKIEEANSYVSDQNKTLIIFDIDNTILEPTKPEGSDQWFYAAINYFQKQGLTYQQARNKVIPIYIELNRKNGVQLVEKEVVALIHSFQHRNIPVIALTSRSEPIKSITIKQLTSFNIDLEREPLNNKSFVFNFKIPASFYHGILFCGDNNKDAILIEFLKQTTLKPGLIIFIDDKRHYLASVEKTLNKKNIPFIGLRYGYLDNKVNNFVFTEQMLLSSKLFRSLLA